MSEPFIAEIKIFAGNFAPRGFAFCNGQLLPIAQNKALFSLVGTTYGGDGRTTLGLPNLQGRAPMHPGRGPGLTIRRLGESGGVETVTLTTAQIPSHSHEAQATLESDISGPKLLGTTRENSYGIGSPVDMSADTLQSTGASQPHNNMQPYLTLSFIIALVGVFPSRN